MGMTQGVLEQHISQRFNQELQHLRERLISMGQLVAYQLDCSLQAMHSGDMHKARQIIARDHQVNAYEVELDEDCSNILVRRQPAARDLRFILMVIKTITDLERIGDEAKDIAYQVIEISNDGKYHNYLTEFTHLGEHAKQSLERALCLLEELREDCKGIPIPSPAELSCDESGDGERHETVNRELITYMMEDARSIPQVLEIMWASRALERISDRSCNICNYVSFYQSGTKTHTI